MNPKSYSITVSAVNALIILGEVLLLALILQERIPQTELLIRVFFLAPILLLVFNVVSMVIAWIRLRPFDLYTKIGFWISIIFSIPLIFFGLFLLYDFFIFSPSIAPQ